MVCRTALGRGERCDDDPAHEVVALAEDEGREVLVRATWGTPDVRLAETRMALHAQQAVALLAIFGFLVGLCGLWVVMPGLGALHVLGAAASMALFWGGGNLMLGRKPSAFPVGGRPLLAAAASGEASADHGPLLGMNGVAAGSRTLLAPASGIECLAYAIELHYVGFGGDRVMLRDAAGAGFDVVLDDGRVAHIPPGRIRLVAPMRQVIDVDNHALERYLISLDPQHEPGRAFDPLRYNVVAETVLLRGEPVELLSRFEPEVNPRAAPTGYREPAPVVWVARELPVLRLSER